MSLFDLRAVSRTYSSQRRSKTALDGVCLKLTEGQRLGVVGESGSGKSTLARILTALDRPTSGEVYFAGQRIDHLPERRLGELRANVQFVFQDPRSSLNPRMRIGRIITEPLRSPLLRGRTEVPTDDAARCAEVLSQVDLEPEMANRYPHEFSGGQRQRIAIARALVGRPKVLVADEPVSALDVSVRAQILNLLKGLADEMNLTLFVVSHDLAVVRELCDSIAVLNQGRIVEYGATRSVLENPKNEYTERLLAAIPQL